MLAVSALVVLSLVSVSYVRALMAPGHATWSDKTSSWIGDHGGAPALNLYENWRYASPPPDTQPDLTRHDSATAQSDGSVTSIGTLPVLPAHLLRPGYLDTLEPTEYHSPIPQCFSRIRLIAVLWPELSAGPPPTSP